MQFVEPTSMDVDEAVLTAEQESIEIGRITPLLKVELWAKIQTRRLSEGKGELSVEFNSPPQKRELTEDEEVKARDRRESNRLAALKCRKKKKACKQNMSKLRDEFEMKNRKLKEDVKNLEEEIEQWRKKLVEQLTANEEELTLEEPVTVTKTTENEAETTIDMEELCNLYYINSSQEVPSADDNMINNRPVSCTSSTALDSPRSPEHELDWLGDESFISLDKYL